MFLWREDAVELAIWFRIRVTRQTNPSATECFANWIFVFKWHSCLQLKWQKHTHTHTKRRHQYLFQFRGTIAHDTRDMNTNAFFFSRIDCAIWSMNRSSAHVDAIDKPSMMWTKIGDVDFLRSVNAEQTCTPRTLDSRYTYFIINVTNRNSYYTWTWERESICGRATDSHILHTARNVRNVYIFQIFVFVIWWWRKWQLLSAVWLLSLLRDSLPSTSNFIYCCSHGADADVQFNFHMSCDGVLHFLFAYLRFVLSAFFFLLTENCTYFESCLNEKLCTQEASVRFGWGCARIYFARLNLNVLWVIVKLCAHLIFNR